MQNNIRHEGSNAPRGDPSLMDILSELEQGLNPMRIRPMFNSIILPSSRHLSDDMVGRGRDADDGDKTVDSISGAPPAIQPLSAIERAP